MYSNDMTQASGNLLCGSTSGISTKHWIARKATYQLCIWCNSHHMVKWLIKNTALNMKMYEEMNWAATWEDVPSYRCTQWRLKSSCTFVQSDQSSLSAWRNFASLAIQNVPHGRIWPCQCAGWSEPLLDADVQIYVLSHCSSIVFWTPHAINQN